MCIKNVLFPKTGICTSFFDSAKQNLHCWNVWYYCCFFKSNLSIYVTRGEKLFSIVSGYSYLFPVLSIKTRLLQHLECPPMTFIYGDDPLYSTLGGKMLQECMGDRVTVEKVVNASHHIHVQNPDGFYQVMARALERADGYKSGDNLK